MIPKLKKLNPAVVKTARGKGLMNAIEIKPTDGKIITCENVFFILLYMLNVLYCLLLV